MLRNLTRLIATVAVLVLLTARPATLTAGVGPENVIVVVNADSLVSRTIANHYVELRNIPSVNVILLPDVPTDLKIGLEDFKSKILRPVFEYMNQHRLAGQARVIAYSADFPTSVNISAHTAKLTDPNQKKYQKPTASINGLTYLYQFVMNDSPRYLDWGSNLYARGSFDRHFANPFLDPQRRQQFDKAIAKFDDEKFDEAAALLESLLEKSPELSPLAIRVAEAKARSGDSESAKSWLTKAVQAGWASGTYLDESESLRPLLVQPEMKQLRERLSNMPIEVQGPIGFAADVGWAADGHPVTKAKDGIAYIMSCMLSVVHPRGSTVDQAVTSLTRSSESDHTMPSGEVWFTLTGDIRTKTRLPGVGDAITWLQQSGQEAKLIHKAMPDSSGHCVGLMLGTATMKLANRKWSFDPGAISENLTSLSGHFGTDSQSKITDLLHAGAAITSGPVAEPYALQFKFPVPMMYGYYVSGVTAIEAFYLSVQSPYQLLIVGDPLAQPFSRSPNDWVGVTLNSEQDGPSRVKISRQPVASPDRRSAVHSIELFIDGRMIRRVPALANIQLNLPDNLSGHFEFRTVLVGSEITRPRAWHADWIELDPADAAPKITWKPGDQFVQVECSGADSIDLMHHSEKVGTVKGESGKIAIDRTKLGDGPIRLRPFATKGARRVPGRTLTVTQ